MEIILIIILCVNDEKIRSRFEPPLKAGIETHIVVARVVLNNRGEEKLVGES